MATTPQNPEIVARYLTAANTTVDVFEGVVTTPGEDHPIKVSSTGRCNGCATQHMVAETLAPDDDHMWSIADLAVKNVRAWAENHAATCRSLAA